MGRFSRRVVVLLAAVGCVIAPAIARGQQATAGLGLSDSAATLACTLYPIAGCPSVSPSHALFDRFQALAGDQTGGANAFRYVRASIPWDAVSTGGAAIGSPCVRERQPPAYYGVAWIALAENYVLAARRAGLDPLIAITTNDAPRYPGNGNPNDPANPSSNQYACGFQGLVATLDTFAAAHGILAPSEYETYDEPDGARVSNECNPTPHGNLPPHEAEQCAAWYYYEADVVNRANFGNRLTLVALSADGDSANDPHLIAVKAYASYLTGTVGLYPSVWSLHPYEDLSAAAYPDATTPAHGDTALVSAYIASLYASSRQQPKIWLTETAAQITDPVSSYLGLSEGCSDAEADDPPPYGLGGCLDGNPKAQASAAADFLDLARAGSALPGQITRVYWHEFDSLAAHPTGWDSALVSPGDRYVRASYCVLSGESVARTLADPICNQVAAAEDSQDSARGYPEPDAQGPGTGRAQVVDTSNPALAAQGKIATADACPQPWCAFSLLRLRLTELESG